MGTVEHLTGLGLVASGIIRILAAYVLFIVLTRLSSRSRTRHALWLLFLIGAGVYWADLLVQVLKPQRVTVVATRSVVVDAPSASSGLPASVTIPFVWNHRLELASEALVLTYVGGAALMLIRLARRRRSLRQAVSKARPVSPELNRTFEAECRHLGVSRCRILELPGLSSPGTAYAWKPVVLIPDDLDGYLDSEQFIDVLYHELMHVRRLDFLWGALGDIVGCLLFFHPAVWLALRNLRRERELACDGAVMNLRRGRRADYAVSLARLARRRVLGRQLDPPSHLALLNSFLAFRVQTLLAGMHRRSRGAQSAAMFAGLLALFVFFAGWPSLSLAIEVGARPMVSAPLVVQAGHSTASQKMVARRGKPRGPSTEIGQPLANPPASPEIPFEPNVIASLPVSDSGRHDAWILSPHVEAGGSLPEAREPSVWDEAPPLKPAQSPRSWRQIVMGAAIDAVGRVSQGRRPDEKE
jgi:beta-lactamase regulating signal transducer with metallopeptidase domain